MTLSTSPATRTTLKSFVPLTSSQHINAQTDASRLMSGVINNEATRDYAAGFRKGQPFTSSEDMGAISNLFLYWYSLRTVYSTKRYFDNSAKAHKVPGMTGGDQGDPLESCAYSLSTLHLIGAVMARHPNAVAAAVIDDLTLKGPLSEEQN